MVNRKTLRIRGSAEEAGGQVRGLEEGGVNPLPTAPRFPSTAPNLWRILPRDVRTLTVCQLMGFPTKPLKVKLFAGEQKATEKYLFPDYRGPVCMVRKTSLKNGIIGPNMMRLCFFPFSVGPSNES